MGEKAARRKEEHVNYLRRDFKYNKLQNDRNDDYRNLGRKRPLKSLNSVPKKMIRDKMASLII